LENTSDEVVEGESMDVKANLSVVIVAGGNEIAAVLSETEAHVSKLLLMSIYMETSQYDTSSRPEQNRT
jgi:hypothetical protein